MVSFLVSVTNGHCSCDCVQKEARAISVAAFVEAVVKAEEVKSVEVGWSWGVQMKSEASLERLSIHEFVALNENANLRPDTLYRLSDPNKYLFQVPVAGL